MATKKITELGELLSGSLASSTDVLAIVDTTANTTNKITIDQLTGNLGVTNIGQNITDPHIVTGHMVHRYNEFLADVDPLVNTSVSASAGLTAVAFSDANVDAGVTMSGSAVHTAAWDSNAAGAATLPAATVGNMCIWRQSALADEASDLVFTCAGTDTYEANQIIGDGIVLARKDVSAGTDKVLTITCAATNEAWGSIGSTVSWYCRQPGKWLVKVNALPLGTGAGGDIAFS